MTNETLRSLIANNLFGCPIFSTTRQRLSIGSSEFSRSFRPLLFLSISPSFLQVSHTSVSDFLSTSVIIQSHASNGYDDFVVGSSPYNGLSISSFSYCRFVNCSSSSEGGAIYISSSSMFLCLYSNIFSNCNSSIRGGGLSVYVQNSTSSFLCFSRCTAFITSNSNSWGNAAYISSTNSSLMNASTIIECSYTQINNSWDGSLLPNGAAFHSSNINFSFCYAPANSAFTFDTPNGSVVEYLTHSNCSGSYGFLIWCDYPSQSTLRYFNFVNGSYSASMVYIGYSLGNATANYFVCINCPGSAWGSVNSYYVNIQNYVNSSSASTYTCMAVRTWICGGSAKAPLCPSSTMTAEIMSHYLNFVFAAAFILC